MTIQQLKYVITLNEERHFARAAERCMVSQPGLTIQLKKFEEEIGIKIFDRSKVPLKPTALGEEIIEKAKKVVKETDEIRDFIISKKNELKGTIKIGIVSTLSPYLIPLCLSELQKATPDIHYIINEASTVDLIKTIDTGELDIAIMATPTGEKHLREFPIFEEPFVAYLGKNHPQAMGNQYKLDDDDVNSLILLESEFCYNSQLLNICQLESSKATPKFSYQINSIESLKRMVKADFGFAILPWLSTNGEKDDDTAVAVPFEAPIPVREISLVTSDTFSKKLLIKKISKVVYDCLPDALKLKTKHKKIRWNDSPYFIKSIAE
ncbi:MAG: LysR substrate-binding domain-containing protein [Bacteroidota bacterium]